MDALFFIHDFIGPKFDPSLFDNISLRVPSCNVRSFALFYAASKLAFSRMYNSGQAAKR